MTWFLVIAFLFTLDINQVWFLKPYIYILGVFTENPFSKSLERARDVSDIKINMALFNLIGRWGYSAVRRKTAYKCITASILAFI